ncbi:MAG: hypothetical protein KF699_10030 [Phycisphaeraceae bacterium]|nr:hypothetical protein [Phycisphaeraceae bacterium]
MARTSRKAFTLVELAALVAAGSVAMSIAAVSVQPGFGKKKPDADQPAEKDAAQPPNLTEALAKARASARQLKDATQVRGIMQSMIIWANNNNGKFPLPSEFDTADDTVSLNGRAKDTTANILSVMIFNGSISTELCISAAEVNPNIKVDGRYEFDRPKAAIRPAAALWDPGFKADFTKDQVGNNSFAHLQPSDGRLPRWADTFSSLEPIVSNRAPEIEKVERKGDDAAGWTYEVTTAKKDSLTLQIHGAKETWEGNVGFGDGHVDFMTRIAPEGRVEDQKWLAYTTREGKKFLDTYFFDEDDDKEGSNACLGIFTTAGKSPKDFRGIWD